VTISALIIRLRAFSFFGFSSDLDSEFVIFVFFTVHFFDGSVSIIFVSKNLSRSVIYDKSVVSDDSNLTNGAKLTEEVFEISFSGAFWKAPDIDLWITHELIL
jgi:hypothetical protein